MVHIPRRKRLAMGAPELLVIIAIIAILIALLLPAIQAARAAARRAACLNNCKMLLLGALNYESAKRAFPPAGLVAEDKAAEGEKGLRFDPMSGPQFSWVAMLLPYIEEQALYRQYDFSKSVFAQANSANLAAHVAGLLCPAADEPSFLKSAKTKDVQFAKGNYAGFVGPAHIDQAPVLPGILGGFPPGAKKGQAIKDVRDGISRTMFLSEVLASKSPLDPRGAWMLPWSGSSLISGNLPPKGGLDDLKRFKSIKYEIDAALQAGSHVPNSTTADVIVECAHLADPAMPCVAHNDKEHDYWSAAARSSHPMGVNIAMADGSARFIANEIDAAVWAYLICVNDGHAVQLP